MLSLLHNMLSSQKLLVSSLYDERVFYWNFLKDLKQARRSVIIEGLYCRLRILRLNVGLVKIGVQDEE